MRSSLCQTRSASPETCPDRKAIGVWTAQCDLGLAIDLSPHPLKADGAVTNTSRYSDFASPIPAQVQCRVFGCAEYKR